MNHKINNKIIISIFISSLLLFVPNLAYAENVPDWVKNTAGWWATDAISETEFVNAIEFLIKDGIIDVLTSNNSKSGEGVPDWVKNTAGWWATDAISETEFVNSIEFLVNNGIIHVDKTVNSKYPEWLINNSSWQKAREITNSDFNNFDTSYFNDKPITCDGCESKSIINNLGFRGLEISEEKPPNTFRIFSIGGSSTFGVEVHDDETWPAYLQKKFDKIDLDIDVEIINAGINAANSATERKLIEGQIIDLDPDLIIMYDGWNDAGYPISWNRSSPTIEESKNNWIEICKFGNKHNFDSIITIQPIVGTGNRILTYHEAEFLVNETFNMQELYTKLDVYAEYLPELDKVCTKTADLRKLFDYVQEPVYVDWGHPDKGGYNIIAEKMFELSLPIILEKTDENFKIEEKEYPYNLGEFTIYAPGEDFSGKDFEKLDLKNAIFDNSDFSSAKLNNAYIDGARFVRADLSNVNFEGKDLSGLNFLGANLSNTNLVNANLEGANLTKADLSQNNLTGARFLDSNLSGANLEGANLTNVDFTSADLTNANLEGANLEDANLEGANLNYVQFTNVDISKGSLSKALFKGTDLSQAIIINADFTNSDLSNTNLSGQDLSSHDLKNTKLNQANLSNTILPNQSFSGKDFEYTIFDGVDLSNKDLSHANFQYASFDNTDLTGANLEKAKLIQIDFTKIKNKSLKDANITGASITYSYLEGVELPINIDLTNFHSSEMNSVNFENRNIEGVYFYNVKLNGANFENVNMNAVKSTLQFENRPDLLSVDPTKILDELKLGSVYVVASPFTAYDNYVHLELLKFNNFMDADLRNANFSGADMIQVYLKDSNLEGANLEGANLEGANLEGANLEGANLNCINHEICN